MVRTGLLGGGRSPRRTDLSLLTGEVELKSVAAGAPDEGLVPAALHPWGSVERYWTHFAKLEQSLESPAAVGREREAWYFPRALKKGERVSRTGID
jgi:hypothetical protein